MRTLTVPYSGQLLVSHLAAYGLGFALDRGGEECYVGHHPESLEMEPQVWTNASPERVAECVRATAEECAEPVEADLAPGKPVIWARPTEPGRALAALVAREELLDRLEQAGARTASSLLAGLGAPATWIGDKPQRGASALDGVAGNSTSDFVRGVLRGSLPAAATLTAEEIGPRGHAGSGTEDKTLWSPRGTDVDPAHQWLAALGLTLVPVGLRADGRAATPGFWRDGAVRGIALPVLVQPASIPRLRGLLQLPALTGPASPASSGRLRSLGIRELVTFQVQDHSTQQMTKFSFERGRRSEL